MKVCSVPDLNTLKYVIDHYMYTMWVQNLVFMCIFRVMDLSRFILRVMGPLHFYTSGSGLLIGYIKGAPI